MRVFKTFRRWGFFLGVCGSSLVFGGCSPKSFFGIGASGLQNKTYRKFNRNCSLKITEPTLQVKDVKALLHCVNTNRALDSIVAWVDSLEDADLQPFVNRVQRDYLEKPQRAYQVERAFLDAEKDQAWDPFFKQLGILLENSNLVLSLLDILDQSRIRVNGKLIPDPKVLKGLELFASSIQYTDLADALDFGIDIAGAPAFENLQTHFGQNPASRYSFASLMKAARAYLVEPHTFKYEDHWVPIRPLVYQGLLENAGLSFSGILEDLLSGNVEEKIPRLASVFQVMLQSQYQGKSLMARFREALVELNREIVCVKGGRTIPNGVIHIFSEVFNLKDRSHADEYVLKTNPLNLALLTPFCSFPPKMNEHYEVLRKTALTGVMPNVADFIKALHTKRGEGVKWRGPDGKGAEGAEFPIGSYLFLYLLTDAGKSDEQPLADGGFQNLFPIFEEVTARDAWTDLLLVLALPDQKQQKRMLKSIQYGLAPQPQLRGESLWDVGVQVVERIPLKTLYDFSVSFLNLIERKEPILEPLLSAGRKVFYANDVHPFFDFGKEFFSRSTVNAELVNGLIKISRNRSLFRAAVLNFAEIAQGGGESGSLLKDLIDTNLQIFHAVAEKGKGAEIVKTSAPTWMSRRTHDFRTLPKLRLKAIVEPSSDAVLAEAEDVTYSWYTVDCKELKATFDWADVADPDYANQIERLIRCQGNPKVIRTFDFLRSTPTSRAGESVWDLSIQLGKELSSSLSKEDNQYLIDAWIRSYKRGNNGTFFQLLNAFVLFVNGQASSLDPLPSSRPPNSVLVPLLSVLGKLYREQPEAVVALEKLTGALVGRSDFPNFLKDLHHWADLATRGVADRGNIEIDALFDHQFRGRVRDAVMRVECANFNPTHRDYQKQLDRRVEEIIQETQLNVTNWDLVPGRISGPWHPRQRWTFEELSPPMSQLWERLRSSGPAGVSLVDAQVDFLRYFSLPEHAEPNVTQHYQPREFLNWLQSRSRDYKLFTYFYPVTGKDPHGMIGPRVRLLNSLDLLELVVINSDILDPTRNKVRQIPLLGRVVGRFVSEKNTALVYLSEYARAWGDVPRNLWPIEVQQDFPEGGPRPKTLLEATADILSRRHIDRMEDLETLTDEMIGLPTLPPCYMANFPGTPQPKPSEWNGRGFFPPELVDNLQRRLWNLWQVGHILEVNSPPVSEAAWTRPTPWVSQFQSAPWISKFTLNPPEEGVPPETSIRPRGGLEPFRDLFAKIYYSTPPQYRNPAAGDDNHLSFLLSSVKLGSLRMIGSLLQGVRAPVDANDPAMGYWQVLNHFFELLVRSSQTPGMREVSHLLLRTPAGHALLGKVNSEVFNLLEAVPAAERVNRAADMRQLILYGAAGLNSLQGWDREVDLPVGDTVNLVWSVLATLLSEEEILRFVASDDHQTFTSLLGEEKAAAFAKMFYKNMDPTQRGRWLELLRTVLMNSGQDTPNPVHAMNLMRVAMAAVHSDQWHELLDRRREFIQSMDYQRVMYKGAFDEVVRFFGHIPFTFEPVTSEAMHASNHLRESIAQLLLNKPEQINEILSLAASHQTEVYEAFTTLSSLIGAVNSSSSPLKNFLREFVIPGLSEKQYER